MGSPRRSFDDGAVGLGIVAAMRSEQRSEAIPIVVSAARVGSGLRERSESYTCVISHVGNGTRVYGDGGGGEVVFFHSPVRLVAAPPPVVVAEEFLSRCFLCGKSLRGIDIFMYRGEKAFCSMECRFRQIRSDEHRDKCWSDMMKTHEYSISPCSAPMHLAAGVAAA